MDVKEVTLGITEKDEYEAVKYLVAIMLKNNLITEEEKAKILVEYN